MNDVMKDFCITQFMPKKPTKEGAYLRSDGN